MTYKENNPDFYARMRAEFATYHIDQVAKVVGIDNPKKSALTKDQILDKATEKTCEEYFRRQARRTLNSLLDAQLLESTTERTWK